MKKIFAWALVLMMVVGLFAGCNGNTENPTDAPAASSNLASAMEYLEAMYKEVGEKTPKDFTRPASVPYGTERYAITWTTNSDEVKVVDNGNGTVTIDVNEAVTSDVNYELTATMADANGKTATYTWKHLLPASTAGDQSAIVNDAYALESGASMGYEVTLTGKIIAVNTPYAADYKNVTVTIAVPGCEDKPIMCYRLKGDGADIIDNGWTITVTGTIKNYNGTIEFDQGCVLDSYVEGDGVKQPENPTEVVDAAYALADGASLPYTATLTGEIVKIDTPYSADYGNITVTIAVEGRESKPITCYRMKGTGADELCVGDTITVKGLIKNYKGTIEFDTGCQLINVVPGERLTAPEDPYEILDAAYALKRGENLPYEVTLSGIVTTVDEPYSEEYNNITVSITLVGAKDQPIKCFRLKGDGISKIKPSDTITVKGYITNYEGEREFVAGCQMIAREKGPGYPAPATQEEIVEHIKTLPITCTLLYKAKLTGEIVKVNSAYSSKYGNITVTIGLKDASGNDFNLKIYRMKQGKGLDEIKKGDTITVEGYITNYVHNWEDPIKNSEVEMINAKLLSFETTETPVGDANYPTAPATLSENKAYKLVMIQSNLEKVLVFNGKMSGKYLGTTTTASEYVDVYAEVTSGGYYFYFMDGNTKKYIDLYVGLNSKNEDKAYPEITDTPEHAWSYDAESKLYTIKLKVGNFTDPYFLGTYDDYNTISTSSTYYITEENAANYGVGQFAAILMEEVPAWDFGGSTEPEEPFVKPTTPEEIVNAAYALDKNETLAEGPYTLTGEITKVGTYNSTYKDVNVTIVVNGMTDKPIECYALKGEGNDSLKVGDTITVTGTIKNYNGKVEFEKPTLVSVNGEGGSGETPDTPDTPDIPTTGTNVVIYAPAYNKALSAQKTGYNNYYNLGVDVTVSGTTMTGYGATEVWTLIDNGDGTYSFANGGQNIGLAASNSSMNLGAEHDTWEVEPLGNGLYNLKNVGRGNYMEWYNEKSNWSTYSTTSAATDDQFQMAFYVVSGTLPNFGGSTTPDPEPDTPDPEPDVPAQPTGNHADFNTIKTSNANGDSGYKTSYTTTNGWVTEYSAIQTGGSTVMNPQFPVIGPDNTYKAVCMSGSTTNPGKITSPVLTGGISKLTITYTKMFTDTKLSATVTIIDKASGTVYTNELSREADKNTKYEEWTYEWTLETPISGNFTIEILNNSPSNSTSNKDRITVLDISWENNGSTGGGNEGGESGGETPDPTTDPTPDPEPDPFVKPTTPEEIVNAAYALEKDETLAEGPYTLTGEITQVGTYNSTYKDVNVTIVVNGMTDKPIECYALKGEGNDSLKVGDTITVIGTIKNFNGKVEFDKPNLDAVVKGEGGEGGESETPALTDPKAIVDAAFALEEGATLAGGPYTLTGVIVNVDTPYDSGYKNITVTIEVEGTTGKKNLKCYRLTGDDLDVVAALKVTDTITVTGEIVDHYGNPQFAQGSKVTGYVAGAGESETTMPEINGTEIRFELGANGSAVHADGTSVNSYTETVSGYSLNLTKIDKFYTGGRDAKGNSCIKLGTGSAYGGFTFTVPSGVSQIVVYAAGYKAATGKIAINDVTYSVEEKSNNGEYMAIVVNVTAGQTITVETVVTQRAMINAISYVIG